MHWSEFEQDSVPVENNQTTLMPGMYDPPLGHWRRYEIVDTGVQQDRLRVATFNIWFGDLAVEARYRAIANILAEYRPDVIALQEVTPFALEMFKDVGWIRDDYRLSHIDGRMPGGYGVLMLTSLPVRSFVSFGLPSLMDRHLLVVKARINQTVWHFATVHLESMKASAKMRGRQIKKIFNILKGLDHVVLMGDFNFDPSWTKENQRLDPAYTDVWPMLRPDEPGYTEDTSVNRMRYLIKGKHKHVRFDRILFKNRGDTTSWIAASIDLLGTAPISAAHPDVFPSDHFGLVCEIRNV